MKKTIKKPKKKTQNKTKKTNKKTMSYTKRGLGNSGVGHAMVSIDYMKKLWPSMTTDALRASADRIKGSHKTALWLHHR